MYKADKKEVQAFNKPIYQLKKQNAANYRTLLENYSKDVTILALNKLQKDKVTEYTGSLNSDELGQKLLRPPLLGDLSLPAFFGQGSDIDKDNAPEIVDLPYGYLYFYRDMDKKTYTVAFHLEKPDTFNPYLDARKTFKQAMPAIIRDNGLITTGAFTWLRILGTFVKL
ncbi:conserved protein of unknown function [Oenococcus oeni]|uniref:hypothetical protein n=1 Tax=Oenococcus oeni TaxID=1247 RepID=UPI00107732AE|nr:hypothetical protein [Oenococcus oeni]AVI94115.1 hypothetical protein AX764_04385 [Oenococcus oeni]SYV99683.1 conserved hypothetical protein [Oenococcus oeni]SYW03857.1 conserved hypothetical protein [Oenococcus oeni]SYW17640.1 conserved hypothetical protein [Oenococcus oeni]VDC14635.1 conserved protein of unknown function [Oenococcus oeni]